MASALESIDLAIQEVIAARKRVAKVTTKQVRGVDELASLKSTAYAWFNTHRGTVVSGWPKIALTKADAIYRSILDATTKHAAKTTYLDALKELKNTLLAVRGEVVSSPAAPISVNSDDLAPDFEPLVGNQEMRDILVRRWHECHKCVGAEAHLAAIVIMGGFLEALFVARANKMSDKSPLINAKCAPKDKNTGKTLNYQDWMLDAYIQVAHELGWITNSAKDVADVLKEYRNYIHPEKERRHGVVLALNDSSIFWQVTKALARQLLMSATALTP
jgi:hypothetical protein